MKLYEASFDDALEFANGRTLPDDAAGELVPVYGSNGCIGRAKAANHSNGIILGRVGAYCGSVAYCPNDFWATDNTIVVYAKQGHHIGFLYYFLLQQSLNRYAGGSAQPLLTQKILKHLPAQLPEFDDQARVWQVLSAYDDLIATNQRRIALLEDAARRLYREWFVHLRFPGHESVPVKDGVPEGWALRALGDVAPLNYGKALKATERKDGAIPVYGSSGVVGHHNRALVGPGAIIVGRKGNVGSLYYSASPCFPIDTVFYIEPEAASRHLFQALHSLNFISSDSAVPGLNRTYAHSLPLLTPSDEIAKAFEATVGPLFEQVENLTRQNQQFARARDLLLPKLMSGQLDVSGIRLPEEVAA